MARKKKSAPAAKKAVAFTDLTTQADDQVSPGGWAEVVSGPHEGRYGAVEEPNGDDEFILRTRDDLNERLVVKRADAIPAKSGRR